MEVLIAEIQGGFASLREEISQVRADFHGEVSSLRGDIMSEGTQGRGI